MTAAHGLRSVVHLVENLVSEDILYDKNLREIVEVTNECNVCSRSCHVAVVM